MGIIAFSMFDEPKSFDEALQRRKAIRAEEAQFREQYKIEHQRGYENLTNLRGAYRRSKNGL